MGNTQRTPYSLNENVDVLSNVTYLSIVILYEEFMSEFSTVVWLFCVLLICSTEVIDADSVLHLNHH